MIIALAVDEDVRWNVVVPELNEKEKAPLLRLKIKNDERGVSALDIENTADLAGKANQVQSLDLKKGIYLIAMSKGLQYEEAKQVRVSIHGGKDPWPVPPPPAPQGTDLAEHKAVYEEQFDKVLIKASEGGPRWIEVMARWKPIVVPLDSRRD